MSLTEAEEFGIANGYAPSAHRVLCIDYDSTLYPWAPIMDSPAPLPGAIEGMRRLKEAGFTLVIFTSRLSPTWLAESGYSEANQRAHIERQLTRDGIPYDRVTSEKVPAVAYLDDKAIRFREGEWPAIVDWLLFSREVV